DLARLRPNLPQLPPAPTPANPATARRATVRFEPTLLLAHHRPGKRPAQPPPSHPRGALSGRQGGRQVLPERAVRCDSPSGCDRAPRPPERRPTLQHPALDPGREGRSLP